RTGEVDVDRSTRRVVEVGTHGALGRRLARVGDVDRDLEGRGRVVVIGEGGVDVVVVDRDVRLHRQVDVPVDAAEVQIVLILHEAAGRPPVDLHGDEVAALVHVVGDVEVGGAEAVLAVPDDRSVD